MANWYLSSVAYTAVQTWTALTGGVATPVATGVIVRQTSPALNSERCFRCTTSGTTNTTEPSWVLTNSSTTSDGTVTWTECTGQEAHQHDNGVTNTWTAPAARYNNLSSTGKNVLNTGDTIFLSSDHAETQASNNTLVFSSLGNTGLLISVSRTSTNLPPLSAQITPGASIACTGSSTILTLRRGIMCCGITFSSGAQLALNDEGISVLMYFRDGSFALTTSSAFVSITPNAGGGQYIFTNTTLNCSSTANGVVISEGELVWRDTPSAIVGSVPATLIFASNRVRSILLDGMDLSAAGSGKVLINSNGTPERVVFANCKLGASVSEYTTSGAEWGDKVDFINCDSGNTNYVSTWFRQMGTISTETTIVRTGGASDGTTSVSHKYVSNTSPIKTFALEGPAICAWNDVTGSAKTVTVEIISSGTLKNDDIFMEVQYLGDSSSCLGSLVTTLPTDLLAADANLPISSATWASSPATPVKQNLSATFTPQKKGLVRVNVKLAKVSTTVYVDPFLTII